MIPRYKSILLKLSGEALKGSEADTAQLYHKAIVEDICAQVIELQKAGVQVTIVIGGGNIFRGAEHGIANDPTTDHFIGMTATIINGMILQEHFRHQGAKATCLSALSIPQLCPTYTPSLGRELLAQGEILILGGGSGNPFCSTDFAGVLRAMELGSALLMKATKVDGIYTKDPIKDPTATKIPTLTHQEALDRNIAVMDTTAFVMAQEHNLPIQVFDIFTQGNIIRALADTTVGSLVSR